MTEDKKAAYVRRLGELDERHRQMLATVSRMESARRPRVEIDAFVDREFTEIIKRRGEVVVQMENEPP